MSGPDAVDAGDRALREALDALARRDDQVARLEAAAEAQSARLAEVMVERAALRDRLDQLAAEVAELRAELEVPPGWGERLEHTVRRALRVARRVVGRVRQRAELVLARTPFGR